MRYQILTFGASSPAKPARNEVEPTSKTSAPTSSIYKHNKFFRSAVTTNYNQTLYVEYTAKRPTILIPILTM
jgi:hypothetical protein